MPTFRESGYPGVVGGIWFAVAANVKTPAAIKQRLAREGAAITASPDYREKMASVGASVSMLTAGVVPAPPLLPAASV